MKTKSLLLAIGLVGGCAVDETSEQPETDSEPVAIAPVFVPEISTDAVFLVRHCGDAEDEAELKSEIAFERSEVELARAHALRHAVRKKELEADLSLNALSIAKLPTNRKLTYKIAANSIAGLLELSAIKGLAKGKVIKSGGTANTCVTATAGEVKLAIANSTGTVWRPPTSGQFGTAAVKLGAGMWIQSGNDTGTERIPIYGAVVAISQASADLIAIDDVRQAMVDWSAVLEKAIALEDTEQTKWEGVVQTHQTKLDELRKQLDELKRRPGDNEDGENMNDEFEAIELDETPTGPFI